MSKPCRNSTGAAAARAGWQCCNDAHPCYGDLCEDCWAESQNGTGPPKGIPYLAQLPSPRIFLMQQDYEELIMLGGRR